MDAIQKYIKLGVYPASILIGNNANERKNRKCDFRKACDSFKVMNGKLRKLKIARKYKDAPVGVSRGYTDHHQGRGQP